MADAGLGYSSSKHPDGMLKRLLMRECLPFSFLSSIWIVLRLCYYIVLAGAVAQAEDGPWITMFQAG